MDATEYAMDAKIVANSRRQESRYIKAKTKKRNERPCLHCVLILLICFKRFCNPDACKNHGKPAITVLLLPYLLPLPF